MRTMSYTWVALACAMGMVGSGCAAPGAPGEDGTVMGTATLALTGVPGAQCDLFYAEETAGGPEIGPIPIPNGIADDGEFSFTFNLPAGAWSYTGYLDCVDSDGAPTQYQSWAGADIDTGAEGWELIFSFGEDAETNLGQVGLEICPSVNLVSVVPAAPCAGESVFVTYQVAEWLPESPCAFDLTANLGASSAAALDVTGPDAQVFTLELLAPAAGDYELVTGRVTESGNSQGLPPHAMSVLECGGPVACLGTTIISGPAATDDAMIGGNFATGDKDKNHGGGSELQVGSMEWFDIWSTRSVLRFDLAELPEGATITSADLRLFAHMECSSSGPEPDDCGTFDPNAYAVTLHTLRRPFDEAAVTWNQAAAGDAWAAAAAEDTTVDRYAATAATLGGLNSSVEQTYLNVDVTSSVQDFAAGAVENNGWVIRPPSVPFYESRIVSFRSSDYASEADPEAAEKQPRLTIEWELPGCGG